MTDLEETCYHRLNPAQGFGSPRLFTEGGSLDETMAVENHDVVLVIASMAARCIIYMSWQGRRAGGALPPPQIATGSISATPRNKFREIPKDLRIAPVLSYDMRMTVSDQDLARAAAGGDADAFATLLARHYDRLFGLCFRLTGNRAEAEDLCQDICAVLPSRLRSYRGGARVTTWLYRVAMNAAIDRRRKSASYARALDGWGNWEMARQAAIAEEQAQIGWLHGAMGQLSETLRDTLALVLDDLSHAEVGEILGVSEGTVSWRLSEARKRLREMREKEEAT